MTAEKESSFRIKLLDGYSWRATIEYLRSTITEAELEIYPEQIQILRGDSQNSILHHAIIDKTRLTDYYVNPKTGLIIIGVNMRELSEKIKYAQKRNNQLTLYNYVDNKREFYVDFLSSKSTAPGVSIIPITLVQHIDYQLEDYSEFPDLTVQVIDFCNSFNHISALKCQYAVLQCYKTGMVILAMKDNNIIGAQPIKDCVYTVGNREENETRNGPLINSLRIPFNTVRSMTKINNIPPHNSTMQIWFSPDKPFKFTVMISSIGFLSTYLNDVDPISLQSINKKK